MYLGRYSLGIILLTVASTVHCKVYERCELAKELVEVHEISKSQVATWVCIAKHESDFNTSAIGHQNWDGSGDHGIFQISDLFWCSPPGKGYACGVTCADLEDDDIEDDVICARRIYREHQQLSGDGFNAWAVYHHYCKSTRVWKYIEGCFGKTDDDVDNKIAGGTKDDKSKNAQPAKKTDDDKKAVNSNESIRQEEKKIKNGDEHKKNVIKTDRGFKTK